jgi:hypothetical protein
MATIEHLEQAYNQLFLWIKEADRAMAGKAWRWTRAGWVADDHPNGTRSIYGPEFEMHYNPGLPADKRLTMIGTTNERSLLDAVQFRQPVQRELTKETVYKALDELRELAPPPCLSASEHERIASLLCVFTSTEDTDNIFCQDLVKRGLLEGSYVGNITFYVLTDRGKQVILGK